MLDHQSLISPLLLGPYNYQGKQSTYDELDHKDIAYKKGATKKGIYSILDKIIKTGSKIAINISEKI